MGGVATGVAFSAVSGLRRPKQLVGRSRVRVSGTRPHQSPSAAATVTESAADVGTGTSSPSSQYTGRRHRENRLLFCGGETHSCSILRPPRRTVRFASCQKWAGSQRRNQTLCGAAVGIPDRVDAPTYNLRAGKRASLVVG